MYKKLHNLSTDKLLLFWWWCFFLFFVFVFVFVFLNPRLTKGGWLQPPPPYGLFPVAPKRYRK